MNKLKGKTALITGGAKRLGKEVSIALAKNGINTVIHYNNSLTEAEETAELSRKEGVISEIINYDFADQNGISDLLKKVLKITGNLDIIINSASVYPEDTLETLAPENLSDIININTIAPFLLAREFKKICSVGSIVNFLDARMTDYEPRHISYQLSKQMLFSLTKMMSLEFAPDIRVNGVAPGIIIPDSSDDKTMVEKMRKGNPLNKIGTEQQVSDSVVFLLENDFITGQIIYVDGGRNIKGNIYGY